MLTARGYLPYEKLDELIEDNIHLLVRVNRISLGYTLSNLSAEEWSKKLQSINLTFFDGANYEV